MVNASVEPAPKRSGGPGGWVRLIVRDVILGDAPGRLWHARFAVPLVTGLTALYVAATLVLPGSQATFSFALVPLALAAVLLPGAWATVIAATTIGTARPYNSRATMEPRARMGGVFRTIRAAGWKTFFARSTA